LSRYLAAGGVSGPYGFPLENVQENGTQRFEGGVLPPPSSISLTSPNGGQVQVAGTNEPVTWTSSNLSGNVKIAWSSNGGATWTPVYHSTPNDGFAWWTVQPPATNQARIRIASVDDPGRLDTSDANFTITQPALTLLSPNGAETQLAGSNQLITWTGGSVSDNVKLEWSVNGGVTWIPIYNSTENDGVAVWTVQPPATTQARIRVSAASHPNLSDSSNANFTIQENPLTLTSPNGGEVQVRGTNQAITWMSSGVSGNVRIDYSTNGGASWLPIYHKTENDGFALWTVQGPPTTVARIRIASLNDPSRVDTSNADFTIAPSAAIRLTLPNGGESYQIGTTQPIAWSTGGLGGNVRIEYSSNGGLSWLPIYDTTPNDGSALWTVQGPVTAQARIRVSWASDTSYADVSDAGFTIRSNPGLQLQRRTSEHFSYRSRSPG
jgi:hypothetical protein